MQKNWQKAFSHMTYGIYVLTTRHTDTINGMIASWAAQVSYEPPLIMTAVHPNRYCHKLIEQSKSFALHVVECNQNMIIERMMGSDPAAKFSGIEWRPGRTGCPILIDCLAWFECSVNEQYQPGNHTLFIARVLDAKAISSGTPLNTNDCKGAYIGNT